MHKHKRRKLRPTLVLQWLIIALIVMIVLSWFKVGWFFLFFPLFFWGGCWKHEWHNNHDSEPDEEGKGKHDDDIDYV